MNITIQKKDFLRLLSRCQGIASRKATMPALTAVLLTAVSSSLDVAATDTFMVVRDSAPATVSTPGSVAVNARDILARVAAMPEGPLSASLAKDGKLTIKAGGSSPRKFTVSTIPASDFPELPAATGDAKLVVEPAALIRLLDLVKVSVAPDETRPHLNSALFEWTAKQIRMVSTNGHMLSHADHAIEWSGPRAEMLVPLRALTEIHKLASSATGPITMRPVDSRIFFEVGSVSLGVKLVDTQFPPYEQVIPKGSLRTFKASRAAMIEAFAAVKIAAVTTLSGVRVATLPGVLRITSESPDAGASFDEVQVEATPGAEVTVGFSANYVCEVLSAMVCDVVTIGLGDEFAPMMIRPDGEGDHLAVIMPMKI